MAETEYPVYKIPSELEQAIVRAYGELWGLEPAKDKHLRAAIEWSSSFYIDNPSAISPWSETRFQKAYLTYYFVKNFLRARATLDRLEQVSFLNEAMKFVDFGSGNGAFAAALSDLGKSLGSYNCIEQSEIAKNQAKLLLPKQNLKYQDVESPGGVDTLVFSYSLTELEEIPSWVYSAKRLIIIEPSTHQDGRRLLDKRQGLIDRGFFAWAPCTHQATCPLLTQSNKDWCHDSFDVEYPAWLLKIMKDSALRMGRVSTSYLAMSKQPALERNPKLARVVGNPLSERGKRKQLLCRGPEREFLSWFTKREEVHDLARGELVVLPETTEEKSNEIRKLSGLEKVSLKV